MATIISTKTSGVGGLEVTGDATGILQLASNNGTTAVTVDASQNVGIGTSSPSQKLQITNLSSSGFAAIRLSADSRSYDIGIGGSTSGFQQNNYYLYDVTAGQPRLAIDTSGNLQFNSGYGSVATAYGCRAWVNFNGTGTVAIRASGNVTSITDNGTGDYTVNMTNAMPDINYSYTLSTMAVTHATTNSINQNSAANEVAQTTTAFRFVTRIVGGGGVDTQYNNVSVFR